MIPTRACVAAALLLAAMPAAAYVQFGAEELIQDGGADIEVNAYSVPDLWDWDGDGRLDLIVGEGGGGYQGKIRVYLNLGSDAAPVYDGFFYVQSAAGGDLIYTPG